MCTDVLIVGAGPAGLTAAAVLAEHGVDFRIVDSQSGPVAQSRAALVHVRTLELLDRLSLAGDAVARGVKVIEVEIDERGRRVASFPLTNRDAAQATPFPFALGLEQSQTEQLLADRLTARSCPVRWKTSLEALTATAEGAEAILQHPDGAEHVVHTRWVVGADGSRSPVRRAVGVGMRGGTFEQSGLLADVDLELPTRAQPPEGTLRLNLTSGGFVGLFGLPSGRCRLFGAVPPHLTTAGGAEVSHEPYAAVAPGQLQRWLDEYFTLDGRIRYTAWTALFRIHSRCADRFRTGNVFLIGDAAHLHSPAGGQGMNLAIGDAFNLGWKLALVATGQAHHRLLDSYEAERYPVAKAVLRGSDRGFALETTSNPIARWIRTHLAARLIGLLTRLRPVRHAIFALFSQTWIRYPHSPIVDHRRPRRGPRPGDRAPFGYFDTDESRPEVFDVCGDLRHHLLFFAGHTTNPQTSALRSDVDTLLQRYAVPISVHEVPAEETHLHACYGATAPQLVLIRPDGHIAYKGAPEELEQLKDHLDQLYVRTEHGVRTSR